MVYKLSGGIDDGKVRKVKEQNINMWSEHKLLCTVQTVVAPYMAANLFLHVSPPFCPGLPFFFFLPQTSSFTKITAFRVYISLLFFFF